MSNKGILLLAHGSRNQSAVAEMIEIAENYRRAHPEKTVYYAFEEFAEPTIEQACQEISKKHQKVVVVPLYLTQGRHLTDSLPERMVELEKTHPELQIVMASHIGADKRLSDIIEDRINEIC